MKSRSKGRLGYGVERAAVMVTEGTSYIWQLAEDQSGNRAGYRIAALKEPGTLEIHNSMSNHAACTSQCEGDNHVLNIPSCRPRQANHE